MRPMRRYGMTIPLDGVPMHEQRDYFEELARLGYTDLWSSEANGTDGFTPLALAATWAPSVRLGCAVVPVFTRGPGILAMSAGSLEEAAPGRFVLGLGTSSNVIVGRWNAIPFEKPYQRTRDVLRFLRMALRGEKVTQDFETFSVKGFRLGRVPKSPPPIMLAALRPGMLRLAGREADGAILNWLSADDVKTVIPHVHDAGDDREIVARIFVCPSEDSERVRALARMAISTYLNVPVYAAFHEWLGRGASLGRMWELWRSGDRKGAAAAIPDEVVDELVVHGSPAACRAHIQRYVQNGVDTPVLAVLPFGLDARQAARDLAMS